MNIENFIYWLQGMLEGKSSLPADVQLKMIEDHLKLVMTKVTPNYNPNITINPAPYMPQQAPFNPLQNLPFYGPQPSIICSTELPQGSVRLDNLAGGSTGTLVGSGLSNFTSESTGNTLNTTLECATSGKNIRFC